MSEVILCVGELEYTIKPIAKTLGLTLLPLESLDWIINPVVVFVYVAISHWSYPSLSVIIV